MANSSLLRPNAYGTITVVCLVGSIVSALLGVSLYVLGGFGAVTVAIAMRQTSSVRSSRDDDGGSGDANSDDGDEREGELDGQKGAMGFS